MEANDANEACHSRRPQTAVKKPVDDGRLLVAWMSYLAANAGRNPLAVKLLDTTMKNLIKAREKPELGFLNLPPHWFWPPPEKMAKKKGANANSPLPLGYPFEAYASILRGVRMRCRCLPTPPASPAIGRPRCRSRPSRT